VADTLARIMMSGALQVALAAAAMSAGACLAQQAGVFTVYPVKPIRIITASSPGTAEDYFARSLGEELRAFYRQRVIVENRSGAGGLIGNDMVSKASADGYTLGMISVSRIIRELMHERPPYRALADIVGVAHVASITNVLAVAPSLPVRTAAQFVAYARPRFGELNYASLGIGSASHLAGEVFTRALGIEAMHVPFRNLSDSYTEMVLGRVHYAVHTVPSVLGPIRDGRMRALAVMTPQRSPTLPEVPAIAEFGLPEAQFDSWSGIVAPSGTPRRVVEQLHGDIVRALSQHPGRLRPDDAQRILALPGTHPPGAYRLPLALRPSAWRAHRPGFRALARERNG
jgi:tripartite-type tricarboxylate transporter receptor subunit TctC